MIYLVTREFSPEHDSGIAWNDPDVGVRWPLNEVIVSEKDRKLPRLRESRANFEYGMDLC